MVNRPFAETTHANVRRYYKGQFKSGNKQYEALIPTTGLPNPKAAPRQAASLVAGVVVNLTRATDQNPSLVAKAVALANFDATTGIRAGNCWEMALMAGLFARLSGCTERIWIVGISGIGDHAFCCIGPDTMPTWNTSDDMAADRRGGIFVIDPWANTVCRQDEYPFQFRQKMRAWSEEGKRILFKGVWTDPGSQEYKRGFNEGGMRYTEFA